MARRPVIFVSGQCTTQLCEDLQFVLETAPLGTQVVYSYPGANQPKTEGAKRAWQQLWGADPARHHFLNQPGFDPKVVQAYTHLVRESPLTVLLTERHRQLGLSDLPIHDAGLQALVGPTKGHKLKNTLEVLKAEHQDDIAGRVMEAVQAFVESRPLPGALLQASHVPGALTADRVLCLFGASAEYALHVAEAVREREGKKTTGETSLRFLSKILVPPDRVPGSPVDALNWLLWMSSSSSEAERISDDEMVALCRKAESEDFWIQAEARWQLVALFVDGEVDDRVVEGLADWLEAEERLAVRVLQAPPGVGLALVMGIYDRVIVDRESTNAVAFCAAFGM